MGEVSDLMYERETVITLNDGEDVARVYTASPSWMRKFDRLCDEFPENFKMTEESRADGQVIGKFYEFPKKFVRISKKERAPQTLTDEQKAARDERLRQWSEKRRRGNDST